MKKGLIALIVAGVIGCSIATVKPKTSEIIETTTTEESTTENITVCTETETHTENTQKTLAVIASAYCPCEKCCGKSDGITATGTIAESGKTIAVDPKVIPLGSVVLVDGVEYVAEDTGGSIKGNKIDIFFDSHDEALEYGRRTVEVVI